MTSAWKRRPRLSISTMSPAPMPLRGRPHARDARRRPGRIPTRAGAARRSRSRSVRTQTIVVRSAASARPSAARNLSTSAARSQPQPYSAAACAKSRPCGVAMCSTNASPSPRRGQEVEDPAAVVVEQHDDELQAEPRGGEQPADVVGERDVADQQHDRPARGGGDAERGRDRAVDAVRAAVGEHAERGRRAREERLDVADRHRRGDHERRVVGQRRAELGGDARLAQVAEHRGDRRRRPCGRRRARRRARSRSLRRLGASGVERGARVGGRRSCRRSPRGPARPLSGSKRDLERVEAGEPGAQRLGGGEVADAQHEVGRCGQSGSRSSAS